MVRVRVRVTMHCRSDTLFQRSALFPDLHCSSLPLSHAGWFEFRLAVPADGGANKQTPITQDSSTTLTDPDPDHNLTLTLTLTLAQT
eukprot:scaffold43097_cov62-Phaeocystis_antarctica.AAC.1